jgi:hypothetical protein
MAGCGESTERRRERLGAAIGVIVLTATLSGCGASTPLCDEGASLADAGRLSAATEKYAQADQRGEGDCADAGLSGASSRYADSFVNVARGAVAEEKGDLEAAVTAYRAALVFDVENATARQALARLQQPVPEFRPPQPVPDPPPATPDRGAWTLGLVTVGLLCAVLGLLAWLALTWRRTARKSRLEAASARTELENAREQIPAIRGTLTELRSLLHEEFDKTAGRLDDLGERIRPDPAAKYELLAAVDQASKREQADAATAMERLRALDDRVSELVDVLDDVVRDRTASTPERVVQQ